MIRRIPVTVDGTPLMADVDADGILTALTPASRPLSHAERWTCGLTDLHQHGADGHTYDTADVAGVADALAIHRVHGTTASMLSLVSAPVAVLVGRLHALRAIVPSLPGVLGVHLEGPFLAAERRGAHALDALRAPEPAAVESLLEAGDGILRQVTLAPELPGALGAISRFVAAGVTVAVGHTRADHQEAARAFDAGANLLTHAFNAMPSFGHRDPGPIGAALSRAHVTLELIADGVHVHPVVLRALFAAAPGRIALVSDAMAATGLGDGAYRLGELEVDVRGRRPVLRGTETLAGSTLTLDRAIEVTVASGVDIDVAVAAATTVPRRALGLAAEALRPGHPVARIVAFDANGRRLASAGTA